VTAPSTTTRPPPWRSVRVLRIAFQAVVVAAVAGVGLWLAGNLRANSRATGIPLTFDYLDQPSSITIPGSSYRQTQSVLDAIGVGLGNTARVAVAGIVLATVLGVLLGIARLSTNWLLSRAAMVYVELFRNVPLLVLVVFAYLAVALRLPRVENAVEIEGLLVVNVRQVAVPWTRAPGSGLAVLGILVAGVAAGIAVSRWRRRVFEQTGRPARAGLAGAAAFVAVAATGQIVLGTPVELTTPELGDRTVVAGGISMPPEYAALLAALTLYTASHIAEIVRGSIQAVPKGQTEAATALALAPGQRMRLVILPQAMRIALPAIGNQYLNLTKNSSLAVAISYFELTKVTQLTVANRATAVPSYALLLAIYLALSLVLSALVNLANRRLALVER
jgi:general L-amino acid transport system permease protein